MKPPSKSSGFAQRGDMRENPPPPTQICWAATAAAAASIARVTRAIRPMSLRPAASVRHCVKHDVDTDGVSARREEIEVLLALALTLPGVSDVGVVRHEGHEAALLI